MKLIKRVIVYLLGLFIVALGINISKMSCLGISPVSSIPRALEVIFGLSLGNMLIVVSCCLVALQLVVLGLDFKVKNILGVLVSVVLGYMTDLLGTDPNAFGHLLINFPRPQSYPMQLVYLLASILIIGIGVYIYLKPDLIPMPAEGLALAISQKSGKPFGDCKSLVDVSMISIALILQFIFIGGFKSFTGDTIVVREGTIASALCVGQVVKIIRKLTDKSR